METAHEVNVVVVLTSHNQKDTITRCIHKLQEGEPYRSFETTENYAFAHRENHSIKFLLQRPALETLEEFNL